MEQAAEATVITDVQGTILYANPAFEKITGYSRLEAVGQNPRILKSGKHDEPSTLRCGIPWSMGRFGTATLSTSGRTAHFYEEDASITPVRMDRANRQLCDRQT